jgi:hypothetical protein
MIFTEYRVAVALLSPGASFSEFLHGTNTIIYNGKQKKKREKNSRWRPLPV